VPFGLSNETNIAVPCPANVSPAGCRAGDMSGQFGNLTDNTPSIETSYFDPFLSLDSSAPNFIGDLSFNVHWANFTVISCGK
jgi:hypothetical protein